MSYVNHNKGPIQTLCLTLLILIFPFYMNYKNSHQLSPYPGINFIATAMDKKRVYAYFPVTVKS